MDAQSYDTWWSQGNYTMPPHQTTIFELPPDLSKVPSLSGSPVSTSAMSRHIKSHSGKVSSTYDQFPGPLPQEYYPQIAGETMHYGTYQIPMTPPEFGSDHDSPYCSPRPPPHVEPSFPHAQMSQQMSPFSGPTERQHTTSGVWLLCISIWALC
jgi:AP-1-like factor